MSLCAECGSYNHNQANFCRKCGSKLGRITPVIPSRSASRGASAQYVPPAILKAQVMPATSDAKKAKFFKLVALFIVSLLAGVWLFQSSDRQFDSTEQCRLDDQYTVETTTNDGIKTVSYKVTYAFLANGIKYVGKDTLSTEPTSPDVTVYFMAADPGNNSLRSTTTSTSNVVAGAVCFLIAIIAYWRLPKDYSWRLGPLGRRWPGIGDSESEHIGLGRGRYSAWGYVHFAFFLQLVVLGTLMSFFLSRISGRGMTDFTVVGAATVFAGAGAIWTYSDRWNCIEAVSSQMCSGWMNLSALYVPIVAFIYANYRGYKKIWGE